MITIQGAYAEALVMTDAIEDAARAQIQLLCDQPFARGARIRVMPDVHAGAGCTIGTTMTLTDAVVPNLVGVDIGCGMETTVLAETRVELTKLDKVVRSRVPAGFDVRDTPHSLCDQIDLSALRCYDRVDARRGLVSLGTLGGGNHFIELDRDEQGTLYLVVHSGSRNLGLQVAKHYQAVAVRQRREAARQDSLDAARDQIEALKAQGRQDEIPALLKRARRDERPDVPDALAYLTGEPLADYLHDMRLMQLYARLNREAITQEILRGMKLSKADSFTTVHNYIDLDARVLRKGAVSARAGERLLIPINMRDGSLLCEGLGNEEYNQSAPHGAGRLFSRAEARSRFTVNQFKKQMEGVYTTSIGASTLDECPMAYKPMDDILRHIAPTARVERVIKPIYNFKAGEEE